jgi:hypothetical protein
MADWRWKPDRVFSMMENSSTANSVPMPDGCPMIVDGMTAIVSEM